MSYQKGIIIDQDMLLVLITHQAMPLKLEGQCIMLHKYNKLIEISV